MVKLSFNGLLKKYEDHKSAQRGAQLWAILSGMPTDYDEAACMSLLEKGIDHESAKNCLTFAAMRDRTAVVDGILSRKYCSVDDRDMFDDTALINAASSGALNSIRLLHKNGADASMTREIFKTAFYFAHNCSNPDCYPLMAKLFPEAEKKYGRDAGFVGKKVENDKASLNAMLYSVRG